MSHPRRFVLANVTYRAVSSHVHTPDMHARLCNLYLFA